MSGEYDSRAISSSADVLKLVGSSDDLLGYVLPALREMFKYDGDGSAKNVFEFLVNRMPSQNFLVKGRSVTKSAVKNALAEFDPQLKEVESDILRYYS